MTVIAMLRQALRGWIPGPLVRDTALAVGLLAVCLPVNNPVATVRTVAAALPDGGWGGAAVTWGWWTGTALALAGVALRRRWPLPMLVVCALATAVHLALMVMPMVVDLAVVVLLGTVAARCRRRVSLAALSGLLLVVAVWCLTDERLGRPINGLPTFSVEVMHHVGPDGRDGGGVVSRAESSNTWSPLAVLGSVLFAAWAVGSGTRTRREYVRQLHARAADLERERDQRAALAVAAERGRISRELHDVVAHGLSLMVIQAQGADAALDNRPADTRSALRTIVKTGRDSLADMRRVLAALGEVDDAWHPQPGLAQLPSLLTRVRRAGTPVRLRVDGTPVELPSAVDLSGYRIVQEALTNVMKHADAGASADVVICYSNTELRIEVSDDGQGTNATDGGAIGVDAGGNGLRGMDHRVTLLGGRLSAGPGPDGGFVVRARLPIEERDE
ncbi:sensor histidine kinase [Micromonospora eburnea]|uniref:histidine kinase n=1 Tax=Micromonospora eburnea TaxID=227316 RepID=A0A1C6TYC6_9ACTN|nr:sensor histidine kinase [Micromonospora eburnea]SCL46832.1 Histidine kinase-, DNA gyrase B-, and HSP90-like ATPase [Micromonospora eburnea]